MFTGIVTAVGRIAAITPQQGDVRLRVAVGDWDLHDVQLGDSIAVNGVCLTVVAMQSGQLSFDVSTETLSRSTLGELGVQSRVNLEKALAVGERMGGHWVSGHVDGLGRITHMEADARSWRFEIEAPAELMKYIAEKGSITIDGVSLTVNRVSNLGFSVNIIPHTYEHTRFLDYRQGSVVNLEVDLIARYLERLLPAQAQGLTLETLTRNGYING